jgi:hypothetical protein
MPFINLSKDEIQSPFYRYTDFGRLVEMFLKKEMTFVRPEKWDDPFENYIIDPDVRFADGSFMRLVYRQVIHGSCWTKKSVSDAMWRIYSLDKISVRIKSTPEKVGTAIDAAMKKYKDSSWYIGKVQYYPQQKVNKKAIEYANRFLESKQDKTAAEALLIKRSSFAHEKEVRILIIDRNSKSKNGVLKIKLDPHQLIDSILIDSRASDEWLDVFSHYLKDVIGFRGTISRSTLYSPIKRMKVSRQKYEIG